MDKHRINLAEIRRSLHRIPEIAFQEYRTRELILEHLETLDWISIHQFKNSTGILVEYSHGQGQYLLFRADMDALPIRENTGCAFSSVHEGMMHACGHDLHMTILLGLIYKVTEFKPSANLLFLFQPAEEGMGGAESILAENLIQSFEVKHAIALHVSAGLPVNTVSTKPGIFFAIPQEFDVEFTGKAAHAAFPEHGHNALAGGICFYNRMYEVITNLQESRKIIFNIGVLESGNIRNIIPDKCILQGTHRTLDKSNRDMINTKIRTLAEQIAAEYHLGCEIKLLCTYDPVINDEGLYGHLKSVCAKLKVAFQDSEIFMTGEDFGFFTSLYPSLLFWLGAGEHEYGLHSDRFNPDEKCLPIGVDVLYGIIEQII